MTFTYCNYLGDLELKKKETPGCRLYEFLMVSGFLLLHQLLPFIIGRSLLTGVRELV